MTPATPTTPHRRQTDLKMEELIKSVDACTVAIAQNRADLKEVAGSQSKITATLHTHIEEEHNTIDTIATFFRDWEGIVRWVNRVGKFMKWTAYVGASGGITVYLIDKISHIFRGN